MSDKQSDARETAARLLTYLRQLKKDRGAMADLRCALSPAKRPRAWPLLGRVGGIGNARVETVAGLFAYHPEETDTGNLGATCLLLKRQNQSFDARFQRLLGCDRDEICERLRPVILAAKAKGIPVNYQQLFTDLWYWSSCVREQWAQQYWGAEQREEPATAGMTESEP